MAVMPAMVPVSYPKRMPPNAANPTMAIPTTLLFGADAPMPGPEGAGPPGIVCVGEWRIEEGGGGREERAGTERTARGKQPGN